MVLLSNLYDVSFYPSSLQAKFYCYPYHLHCVKKVANFSHWEEGVVGYQMFNCTILNGS